MTCEEAINYIHSCGRFSGSAGLHRIRALMQSLGNPQNQLRFIHVAGTNGKGSTCTMIAAILQQAGYRVGLYTSPFLIRFQERITVNGFQIKDDALVRLTEKTAAHQQTLCLPDGEQIGEFEFVTAVAFQYFLEQQCDIVVLETGLGGAFDATNVITPPEVAVLTSISIDHAAVLGRSIEEIAETKAGIIKPGSAVICAPGQQETVVRIFHHHAPQMIIPCDPIRILCDEKGTTFTHNGVKYQTSLLGMYQASNAVTAIEAVKSFASRGNYVPDCAYIDGIASAFLPGRLHIVSRNPMVVVDGGHNEDGVRKAVDFLLQLRGRKGSKLVIGMVADKAVDLCIRIFAEAASEIVITALHNPRAMTVEELAVLASQYCNRVRICDSVDEAVSLLIKESTADDCIAICGSLYLAGEAEDFFNTVRN